VTQSYLGVFGAYITVQHSVASFSQTSDAHGNYPIVYADPVPQQVITVYPLHKLPHHDIVGADYVARVLIDFIMEVPDATVYHKNDMITWDGTEFLVQGFPFNWAGNDPYGFDSSFFGGSVHIERVT
jgi:hypothetical protein